MNWTFFLTHCESECKSRKNDWMNEWIMWDFCCISIIIYNLLLWLKVTLTVVGGCDRVTAHTRVLHLTPPPGLSNRPLFTPVYLQLRAAASVFFVLENIKPQGGGGGGSWHVRVLVLICWSTLLVTSWLGAVAMCAKRLNYPTKHVGSFWSDSGWMMGGWII